MEANDSPLGTMDQQLLRYKQVLDVMPAGVILLDPFGKVAEANPEAYRLLGEPLESIRWVDVINRAFSPREDDGHEVSLRDGRKVKLAISASESGQLILITDMTETRLLQSRVSDLQRLSSLGKMVASLAHQVRTPLSSALLYAANLGAPNLNQPTRQRFQMKLVDRLHDLEKQVNDMLLFAKGGDNKVVDKFTLEHLLNEFEPMVEALVNSQNIDFEINCDNESHTLLGNVNALASALSNLVINAIQVSGKNSKVVVDARAIGDQLFLSVADNGPGIAEELQSKILEPFFTTRQQGTGLGLAVVQMVSHAHKGRLTLQSKPGQGACFTLSLPLANNSDAVRDKVSGEA
ncbi:ATP-binding protein [Enterovibrio sp. ZSDZ35]|uniref:histidine kinase n=1 Tax=Enterovibrio qingdaonensis TaxID=2899818 RepID=A0ABT5QRG2_9GAMM|nr:ATP-binding protein [Enterovibrio sp. ZSDZ35]MDD1783273.1 ATP-binding protein [Enterovibrio sp. ZSDZ35]